MKTYDLQGVELRVPLGRAFDFVADPKQLPHWTHAFASVEDGRAVMHTPNGEAEIGLAVRSAAEHGTVDWYMTFADGSVATAFSRLVELGPERCVFSFVLTPPPVPLEQLEGTMEQSARTLAAELQTLKRMLEENG
jgi:hypothetical protein